MSIKRLLILFPVLPEEFHAEAQRSQRTQK